MNSYILALFALLISINIFSDSYARKPNVIFILADDLGYKELGSYGQENIKTPYLAKLPKRGCILPEIIQVMQFAHHPGVY